MKDLQFYLERIDKRTTEENEELGECWIWKGAITKGRPIFCERSDGKKTNKNPCREIFKLVKMPSLPSGREHPILHRCIGQYTCINPDHLYYVEDGPKQNRIDAVEQQRIPARKIDGKTEDIVKLFKEGVEQQEIAKRLGVCRQTIQRFLNGHMNQYTHNYIKEAEDNRNATIKKLFEEGNSLTQIIVKARVPQTVIFSVVPEIRNRPKGCETSENKLLKQTLPIAERNKQIKELRASGISVVEIASRFFISSPLVYTILKQSDL